LDSHQDLIPFLLPRDYPGGTGRMTRFYAFLLTFVPVNIPTKRSNPKTHENCPGKGYMLIVSKQKKLSGVGKFFGKNFEKS